MRLLVSPEGKAFAIYSETIDLRCLGVMVTMPHGPRASHVEPDTDWNWWADMAPVGGPKLGPFAKRSAAVAAEVEWLEEHLQEIAQGE